MRKNLSDNWLVLRLLNHKLFFLQLRNKWIYLSSTSFLYSCSHSLLSHELVMEIARSRLNIDIIENLLTHWQYRAQFRRAEISIIESFSTIVCFFQLSFHSRSNRKYSRQYRFFYLCCVEIVHRRKQTNNLTLFSPFLSFSFYFCLLETCFTCCSYWFCVKNELRKNTQSFFCHAVCNGFRRENCIFTKSFFPPSFSSFFLAFAQHLHIKYYSFPIDEYSFPFQAIRFQSVW